MTMKKLAELANVSKSTVSKAFSGSADISKETREHIFQIAKERGCYDKYNKRPFDKKVIAVICPEINSEDYSSIVKLLITFLEERNAMVLLSSSSLDAAQEKDFYRYYSTYCKTDGIIIIEAAGAYTNEEVIVPTVSILALHNSPAIDNIALSATEAMNNIISTLKELGHRQIGFVGEPYTQGELALFKSTAQGLAISLNDSSIKVSDKRFEDAGKDAVRRWLDEGTLPTAIVTAYDYIALGVMKELMQNGLRIPEDVSVVGSHDMMISSLVNPPLSSTRYPNEDICKEAVSLLFKKIDNRHYRARHITKIPVEFIHRGSVGPIKKEL